MNIFIYLCIFMKSIEFKMNIECNFMYINVYKCLIFVFYYVLFLCINTNTPNAQKCYFESQIALERIELGERLHFRCGMQHLDALR